MIQQAHRIALFTMNVLAVLLTTIVLSNLFCRSTVSANDSLLQNASDILDSLLNGYDKRLRPYYGDKAIPVNVTMYIYNIGPVSEANMEYTLDLYFRQQWEDPRLAFDGSVISGLALTNEMAKRVWIPDTYFINENKASYHNVLTENTLISITPTGNMLYSTRLTITANCLMDLTYFPMDTQHCTLWLESYAYSNQHIKYKWKGGSSAIYMDPTITLSQFNLLGHNALEEEAQYYVGNYSQLVGHVYLGRSMSYYAIQVYIPATMIVILSWVSFWINPAAVPARVALGITTVLTMTTLMSGVNNSLPKLSYVKAIDYYLVFCYLMVFSALLEFAMVSYGSTPAKKPKEEIKAPPHKEPRSSSRISNYNADERKVSNNTNWRGSGVANGSFVGDNGLNSDLNHPQNEHRRPKSVEAAAKQPPENKFSIANVDKLSRFIFPLIFIIFLFIYWIYYLNVTEVDLDSLIA
ncbi:gamma-aminobutyric acid receptor subunit beta-like [Anneissia japonica]|uniref:gamma-aminobutyric acid receptor subunit beta-like n=1 Tax=Anneissia japonica TaxID=1529436 RepID=UPI001425B8ED|nr:gamma-aminobutyric acid receptor subunit beta-like [Anneissia japonica]